MNRKNNTRKQLLVSLLSLLLCVSMLVGATFAWFTDSVVSGMNTIEAGNLDVELYNGDVKVDSNTTLFDDIELWEPGVVMYENLQVRNVGNLALNYQISLNFGHENNLNGHVLSEVLKAAVIGEVSPNASRYEILTAARANATTLSKLFMSGSLEAGESSAVGSVVIFWDPNSAEIDNLYNANNGQKTSDGEPLHIEFGVNLQATQKMSEDDSFGIDYDKFASTVPTAAVANVTSKFPSVPANQEQGASASDLPLDVAMQFQPHETAAQAAESGYKHWHADYVVTADNDVAANSVALAGYYKAWCDTLNNGNWFYLTSDQDIPANKEIRLIKLLSEMMGTTVWVDYQSICEYGNDDTGFLCGATDLDGTNSGTTLTVELRLYETTVDPANPVGNKNIETGNFVTVGTYTYTFGINSAEKLQDAIDAGADNILLSNDIVLNDSPLSIKNDVTINMNGHDITGISTSNTTSNLIKVEAGASLTLTGNGKITFGATTPDTNWGGEGQPAFPGYANNTISNLGKLVIDGVTIENVTAPGGASYAIDCYQGSDLVVNSGLIDGHGKCAIRMFCNSNTLSTNVTINGGTITGKRGIWVQLPGSKIENVRPVNLTITGGTIISTDASDLAIYSYSYGDSFANTNINISGGEFFGAVAFGGGSKATKENVTISGGVFHDGCGRYLAGDGWEDLV